MNCYFSKNYKNTTNAGNKAKTDIEFILQKNGFKNIGLKQSFHTNKISGFFVTLFSVIKTAFCLDKGDVLVIQYPLKKYYYFICRTAHFKGAKTITLIHDLGSFRRKKLTASQEIKRLSQSDYIIAHNTAMQNWLKENGCLTPIECLEIFDYLSPTPTPERTQAHSPYQIVYAGALSPRKNSFLYEWGDYITNYSIHLYGQGFETDKAKGNEHFICKGFIPSDELIKEVEGDFGLVWDGDSTSSCSGEWGHYLKYNNPHKTSLYIRCELPIIIWEKAAVAPFVKNNNIGICISNLEDLDDILANIPTADYQTMKNNIRKVSQQLSTGYYCAKACRKACDILSSI